MWLVARPGSAARHIGAALGDVVTVVDGDSVPARLADGAPGRPVLVHAQSFPGTLDAVIAGCDGHPLAIASDTPNLTEFLRLTRFGIVGYCNSHMAVVHLEQLHRTLLDGQPWYPPGLLTEALAHARGAVLDQRDSELLAVLTPRERQLALDIAAGLSNRYIARRRDITERTVKTHLSRVFHKLGVDGRLALAVRLRSGVPGTAAPGPSADAPAPAGRAAGPGRVSTAAGREGPPRSKVAKKTATKKTATMKKTSKKKASKKKTSKKKTAKKKPTTTKPVKNKAVAKKAAATNDAAKPGPGHDQTARPKAANKTAVAKTAVKPVQGAAGDGSGVASPSGRSPTPGRRATAGDAARTAPAGKSSRDTVRKPSAAGKSAAGKPVS